MKLLVLSLSCVVFSITFACQEKATTTASFAFSKSNVKVNFEKSGNGVECIVRKGVQIVQRFKLDPSFTDNLAERSGNTFTLMGSGKTLTYEIVKDEKDFSLIKVSRKIEEGQSSKDCLHLGIGTTSWFGGPENRYQYWPVEKASFKDYSFVTKEQDNCAIAERYWLNSKGSFVFINDDVPLFIDQNTEDNPNQLCFQAKFELPYDTHIKEHDFTYFIGVATNAKLVHKKAFENEIFKKPTGYPDERMIRHPIWSTWAEYKAKINEDIVRNFAQKIVENGFNNSQIEIDDNWETCYGSLEFDTSPEKFPNIEGLIQDLKNLGFRVTLWIHPFINQNCEIYTEAKEKNYLVTNIDGSSDTKWWTTNETAAYVDFTNDEAAKWYTNRLDKLKEIGIDSFKFDAGESSWSPKDTIFDGNTVNPSDIVRAYVRTVSKYGGMVEVRTGQGTQDLPIFVRMIDKDTEWGWNNGLVTLITTLLQMNMVGYSFVLPDMIGGNGYNNNTPDYEIFVRWLQANVFMPSLQYSYVPWDFEEIEEYDVVELCKTFTDMHANIADKIIDRFKLAVETGEPVNPPLWWIAPTDQIAYQIYDQFLLGEDILVAPVVEKGKTDRDIYLPEGVWQDGNDNTKYYNGPRWIMNYPANLTVLPYFNKIEKL